MGWGGLGWGFGVRVLVWDFGVGASLGDGFGVGVLGWEFLGWGILG